MLRQVFGFCVSVFCLLAVAVSVAKAEGLTAVTSTNVLITFDSATPGTVSTSVGITGLQAGETILGIDRRPADGQLYAIGSTSRMYRINATTGTATLVGSAGSFTLSGTAFAVDFNPTVDRIRVVSNTGQNLRINPNDGSLSAIDTPVSFAPGDPNAGATPRVVGAAYTNNVPGASLTTLYVIDSNLDIVATQGGINGTPSPNGGQLFTIGAMGFNSSDLVGFDISGLSGVAFAALTAPTGSASQLFTINLTTGAATLIGTIGSGLVITSLTAQVGTAAVPEPASLVLLSLGITGAAVRIRRRNKANPPS